MQTHMVARHAWRQLSSAVPRHGVAVASRSRHFSSTDKGVLGNNPKLPPLRYTVLPNGVRVASQRTMDEAATVGVWVGAGSRNESKQTNGVAHFLEHMAFKGTKNRKRVDMEVEIEDKGAHLNAYTSREHTVYVARTFKEDLAWGVNLLGDILNNSTFDKDAIEAERCVILREMEEVEKQHQEVVFDRLHMAAFRDSTLGYTILGPEENVKSLQRSDIVDYIGKNYFSDRMVVVGSGNVDHAELVKVAQANFSDFKPVSLDVRIPEHKPYFCGAYINVRDEDKYDGAYCAVAFEGVPWTSPDAVTFMLMQTMLGEYKRAEEGVFPANISGNTTLNTLANAENVGSVEEFTTFNTHYKDTGLFGCYVQTEETALEHAISTAMLGVRSLSTTITQEDLARAKLYLKTQLGTTQDSTYSVAEEIGRHLLVYGRHIPVSEFLERIDNIDVEEVKRVAFKYFYDNEIAVSAMGCTHGLVSLYQLRKKTFWLRY